MGLTKRIDFAVIISAEKLHRSLKIVPLDDNPYYKVDLDDIGITPEILSW